MKEALILFVILVQSGCASDNYYYQGKERVYLSPIDSIARSRSSIDYYQNERGTVLGVSDKLIVKLKDAKNLGIYLKEFNLKLDKKLGDNLYLLKTADKNLTINISNALNEKIDIKYSQPDFIKKNIRR